MENLLQGLTTENFWNFYIFNGESSILHYGAQRGCVFSPLLDLHEISVVLLTEEEIRLF